jgi:hypothetical protein
MATAPSPNDLTRQQLDELDALLQRMLSVPLAPPDTPLPGALNRADPPLPPSWRADPPAPVAAPSVPHLLLVAPPAAAEAPAPWYEPPESVADVPKPQAKSPPVPAKPPAADAPKVEPPKPAPEKSPVTPPKPQPDARKPQPDAPKPQAAAAPAVTKPVAPAPGAPPVPFPLLPLVAVNSAFDAVCGVFGPPGKLLRSGFFKHIYGLVGLGLIAYTAAHVAQVQGWVTLPVQLPWPPRTWPR